MRPAALDGGLPQAQLQVLVLTSPSSPASYHPTWLPDARGFLSSNGTGLGSSFAS